MQRRWGVWLSASETRDEKRLREGDEKGKKRLMGVGGERRYSHRGLFHQERGEGEE